MKAKYAGKCRRCLTPFGTGTEIISDGGNWYPVDCEGCAKSKVDLTSLLVWRRGLPGLDDHRHMTIECITGYERGNAHDTSGVDWIVTILDIPHHWMSTTGWRKGTTDNSITFKATSLMEAIDRVVAFLIWYNENGNKEQDNDRQTETHYAESD